MQTDLLDCYGEIDLHYTENKSHWPGLLTIRTKRKKEMKKRKKKKRKRKDKKQKKEQIRTKKEEQME